MNNFSVGYAEDLKNGCNSHGEAIILNPSRRDTTIIHYSIFNIHYSFKFQIAQQRDKLKLTNGGIAMNKYINILQSGRFKGIMGVMRIFCMGRGEGAVYEVFGAGKSHIAVFAGE